MLKKRDFQIPKKLKQYPVTRVLLALLVLVGVFYLGVDVGNGRISFGRGSMSNGVATGLPNRLDYSSVNKVYDKLKDDYNGQLTQTQLLNGLKQGLATSTGDPYTEFFSASEAKQFSEQLNNSFEGIGAQLAKDDAGHIIIISPLPGYPAAKAGLKPKDIIAAVNGQDTTGMSTAKVVSIIQGKAGTKVTLKIVRGQSQTLTFTITRQKITLPSVTTKTLDSNIGYIQISTFADDTSKLASQAADKFASQHVHGIILDLRGDPGGLLSAAVDVSSLWLPQGQTVVQEKRGSVVVDTETANGNDVLKDIPTAVLIDGGSASASEITSAALHDNGLARLIGEQSYGKGSVQQIEDFSDGSELKVTVAKWYRPNGQNVNKKGITPDQVVKLSDQDAKNGNDTQLQAAEAYLNK